MKKVMLMGVHGRIGQNLYLQLKDTFDLYCFSSAKQEDDDLKISYVKKDLFILPEVEEALRDIDIVIFYEDPIMRLNRLTQGRFDDIYLLIADNIARASKVNQVKQIIYVGDELSPEDLMDVLGAYGTPVQKTETPVKRYGKTLSYKQSDYNNVRSIQKAPLPTAWTVKDVGQYYFEWLDEILYNCINVHKENPYYEISVIGIEDPVLEVKYDEAGSDDGVEIYRITGGKLSKKYPNKQSRLEFREMPDGKSFIMALHDYEPNLPWVMYVFTQAPIHALVNRIYQVEMIINDAGMNEFTKKYKR
jgi:hypothetical protein